MRATLLYAIYGGQLFFIAVVAFVIAVTTDLTGLLDQRRLARRVVRLCALLAVSLAVLSAPPLPLALAIVALAACVAYPFCEFGTRSRLRRIVGATAVLCAVAVAFAELPFYVRGSQPPIPSRLFIIGDSLASGGFGENATWPALLAHQLRLPVTNLSLASGDATTALQRQAPLLPAPADGRECVLIEIGGNDMLDSVPVARFANGLDGILAKAGAGGARRMVMFELPLIPGAWRYGITQRRLAEKHGCTLIPKRVLAKVLLRPGNTLDGIHLTQQGHDALARGVVQWLRWAPPDSAQLAYLPHVPR